ncbi:MAG TPA: biotin--[acetyl-CoA-carboxylase] ligase [Thermoanaerobaculia bacterium]|nr:biotin--[acetyl-CoA-carboxylase] ligase [Thermoanaerobaculia bacterium]
MTVDVRSLTDRLERIESVALLARAESTNLLGRRVLQECVENRLALPSAIIIALEQTGGRGRSGRTWYSPEGRGIWATTLHTREARELPLLPLQVAVSIARFARDGFGVDARIKWPNDILVDGAKLAGILIEARAQNGQALVLIGTGINVLPLGEGAPPDAGSIAEAAKTRVDLGAAIERFVEAIDRDLFRPYDPQAILGAWRTLTLHRDGDRIAFALGSERIEGTWAGIDDTGRARIRIDGEVREISAGDLIIAS